MIAKLTGVIDSIGLDWVIVDVNGVGYLVSCSARTLRRLGGVGEAVSLRIDTHVREDAITLYGFLDSAERDWFRLLMTVQGVGARVALSILSTLSPDQVTAAIADQSKQVLTEADGVGPKLGARILNELKDKVAGMALSPTPKGPQAGAVGAAGVSGGAVPTMGADAVSALVNLGYRRADAFAAVTAAKARLGAAATLDALIVEGLKELSL